MSYVIIAKVDLSDEANLTGDRSKVSARFLYQYDDVVIFDISANFDTAKKLTEELCRSLINAGFLSFKIRQSW